MKYRISIVNETILIVDEQKEEFGKIIYQSSGVEPEAICYNVSWHTVRTRSLDLIDV